MGRTAAHPLAAAIHRWLALSCGEGLRLTPEQFAAICEANAQALLELDGKGGINHPPPTIMTSGRAMASSGFS